MRPKSQPRVTCHTHKPNEEIHRVRPCGTVPRRRTANPEVVFPSSKQWSSVGRSVDQFGSVGFEPTPLCPGLRTLCPGVIGCLRAWSTGHSVGLIRTQGIMPTVRGCCKNLRRCQTPPSILLLLQSFDMGCPPPPGHVQETGCLPPLPSYCYESKTGPPHRSCFAYCCQDLRWNACSPGSCFAQELRWRPCAPPTAPPPTIGRDLRRELLVSGGHTNSFWMACGCMAV